LIEKVLNTKNTSARSYSLAYKQSIWYLVKVWTSSLLQ